MEKHYDVVVIGSGPGGYPAAIRAASRGKKTALIEAGQIGGTCLNVGCIPSKSLIASAGKFDSLKQMAEFGITVGTSSFDYAKMVEKKNADVAKIRKSLEGLIKSHGVEIIQGFATFSGPKELSVEGENRLTIKAQKIIIATGSMPKSIPAFPFDGKKILDSTALLDLKKLPTSIAIVGGGVIGCEFASLFNLLGVKVVLIEMMPQLLPMECSSVSTALTSHFKKRGIQIETGAKVEKIETSKEGVTVLLGNGTTHPAEIALVAVGREMNLSKLNLDKAGVKLQNPSQIQVNERMETSVKDIYAVGDIASKWWLAHVATHQGLVAADNACGHPAKMHYNAVPNVIFTSPEIATVGMTLEEAKKAGYAAASEKFPLQALGKAQVTGKTEGFVQWVIDQKTGALLGAQSFGYEASSMIGESTIAIQNELLIESVQETIHPHPTLTESWMEAAFLSTNLPLHLPPKAKK